MKLGMTATISELTTHSEDFLKGGNRALSTHLRHDLDYLRTLIVQAIRLHRPSDAEQATMLADIRDYIMFLTLDGLKDLQLAEQLVDSFFALQAWLQTIKTSQTPQYQDAETIHFYLGFLFTMEQLLSLRHEITMLPHEMISRQDFQKSWIRTARKLNFT
jgi:hypothetical protein